MRLDLTASELLTLLQERWPYGGHGQLRAEMFIEDALRAVVQAERERCIGLIQTKIALLERSGTAFSQNAANQLKHVLEDLNPENDFRGSVIPPEEIDV